VGVPVDVDDLVAEADVRHYVREHVLKHFPVESRPTAAPARGDTPAGAFWFVGDAALRERLAADWHEAQDVCHVLGWKSCVILCGGILEALLEDALGRAGSGPKRRLLLPGLVTAATERRLLKTGTFQLSPTLLAFRTLIRSGLPPRTTVAPDRTEAEAALDAVRSCLQQLAATTPRSSRPAGR
jgi:hypothetical protein